MRDEPAAGSWAPTQAGRSRRTCEEGALPGGPPPPAPRPHHLEAVMSLRPGPLGFILHSFLDFLWTCIFLHTFSVSLSKLTTRTRARTHRSSVWKYLRVLWEFAGVWCFSFYRVLWPSTWPGEKGRLWATRGLQRPQGLRHPLWLGLPAGGAAASPD